ncbi:MAG: carboxylating nicotinate-nucleotide diphosphorylase [Gammaproteobacteria bacterium]|nr:carboxylating nicotinate-nucleotide diphosphorylase [Gammaproteobacteria bacterium]
MSVTPPDPETVAADVARALAEDVGDGDLTAALVPEGATARATVTAREAAVLCGRAWFDAVFAALDPGVQVSWAVAEGDTMDDGTVVCRLDGPARPVLTGERTALNFLQLLSGTATATHRYAAVLEGTGTRLLDTRKTVPGLRCAQKYAVRVGGGQNHRMGLYDAFLVKENHIAACGGIMAAVDAARARDPDAPVEVEVETLGELREAIAAGAERVLLDNFALADMRRAVAEADGRIELEASGNVDLPALAEIAATGVDFVSVGALTKHLRAVDLSLRLELG